MHPGGRRKRLQPQPLEPDRMSTQIKVAAVSEEEVTAGVPAIIEKWRETFDR